MVTILITTLLGILYGIYITKREQFAFVLTDYICNSLLFGFVGIFISVILSFVITYYFRNTVFSIPDFLYNI